jgi:hypothetical protein
MANFDLLSALGTLGAGFSAYGQERQRKDALSRALDEQQFERGRLMEQDRMRREAVERDIEQAEQSRTRQSERDVLDAILGGLRPQGGSSPLTIGGRTFEAPSILTPEEKISQGARRWKTAFPQLTDAQADLIARGVLRPGEVLIDPGTRYNAPPPSGGGRRTTMAITPPANSPRTLFMQRFGTTLDTKGTGLPR